MGFALDGLLDGIGGFKKNIYISNLFFNTQMVLRHFTKEEAKEEVKKLVDKYNRIFESGSIKRYKEEDTKAEFIEPLFEALGWDVRNTENDDEVVREEKISKGRVDYSFRINGIPKFFLEAKALKEDLDNIKFVEQAVNYSWHKGCTWAILTHFEAIKIFNAEWKSVNPSQAQFGQTLPCQLFLEKFDTLWLLSRESFENKLLDIEAEKWGKKIKKISVDKQLLSDLTRFRDLLNKNILKNNASKNISGDELDEAVQRIIDRLIFIRTLEDKELEAPMLQSVVREDLNKRIYKKLNLVFRKIDDIYNSKLFTPHLCENLDIDDEVLAKIINGLFHSSDNSVHYDFSAIDADVLGNIYEQYLGHILKKTDKRAKLAEGKAHRKEQGIYYTPTYVVDYIVKNTVGELAKDKKFNLKNIKILDPACGSGSFLMKAFDYLVTLDKKKNGKLDQTKLDLTGASATYGRKVEILKDNIFGVDLDPKAVEIAQLNLLLKAAEKKHRLPTLQENIKVGNSLFDEEKFAENREFDWEIQFKETMSVGGFDVVIGNPPYVDIKGMPQKQIDRLFEKYKTAENRINLYSIFVERAIQLLRNGGYFGFIIPNSILFNSSYAKIRKLLLDKVNLIRIVRLPDNVFEEAKVETIILIFKKKDSTKNKKTDVLIYNREDKINLINDKTAKQTLSIKQEDWEKNDNNLFNIFSNDSIIDILNKIENGTTPFIEVADFCLGVTPYDKYKGHTPSQIENKVFHADHKKDESFRKLLSGSDITRYGIFWNGNQWIKYGTWLGAPREKRFFTEPRIVVRQIVSGNPLRIYAGYSEEELYNAQIGFNILAKDENKIKIKYLLALINSKLMNFYHTEKYLDKSKNLFQKILIQNAKKFPIKITSISAQDKMIVHVDKLLKLISEFEKIKDRQTDEKVRLEKEIQKLDDEIDEEVYKLYRITNEEKKIIEDSLK